MIKSIIPIILVLVFVSDSFPQNTFSTVLTNPTSDDNAIMTADFQNASLFLVGRSNHHDSISNSNYSMGSIWKISSSGQLINNIFLSDSLTLFSIFKKNNNSLIVFGDKKTLESGNLSILFSAQLDTNLNLIWEKNIYSFSGRSITHLVANRKQNNFLLAVTTADSLQNPPYTSLIFEISQTGDIVNYVAFPEGFIHTIEYSEFRKSVFLTSSYFQSAISVSQIIKLDTLLNIDTIIPLPFKLNHPTAVVFEDDCFFLAGNSRRPGYNGSYPNLASIGVMKMNQQFAEIDYNILGKEGDTLHYRGIYNAIDIHNSNTIYVGGTANFSTTATWFKNTPSWITIANLDSNLTIRWERFLGGDAYYDLWSVLATSDGGCLLTGTRYDHLTQFEERDVVILKIDSTGSITGTNMLPEMKLCAMILYPNPTTDILNIQIGSHTEIQGVEIFNLQGKLVLSLLDEALHTINISTFPSGIYLLKATCRNGEVITAKFEKR